MLVYQSVSGVILGPLERRLVIPTVFLMYLRPFIRVITYNLIYHLVRAHLLGVVDCLYRWIFVRLQEA